jgi:hypothetical protein
MPNSSRDAPQLGILVLQPTTHTAILRYRIRNGISLWIGNVDAATLNNDDNNIRPNTMTPIGDMMGTGLIEPVSGMERGVVYINQVIIKSWRRFGVSNVVIIDHEMTKSPVSVRKYLTQG